MSAKTLGIIVACFAATVIVIGIAMLAGSGWETPGQYTGPHNAANKVTDSKNCYSFQTGCTHGNNGTLSSSDARSGAALSGNYYGP